MITCVAHTAVCVPDVETAVAWYHDVLGLQGRSHLYEGHDPSVVVHGVRMALLAGCRSVLLTNAAGGGDAYLVVGGGLSAVFMAMFAQWYWVS